MLLKKLSKLLKSENSEIEKQFLIFLLNDNKLNKYLLQKMSILSFLLIPIFYFEQNPYLTLEHCGQINNTYYIFLIFLFQ